MDPVLFLPLIGFFIVLLIFWIVVLAFFKLWLRALLSGTKISFVRLVGMRLRKVNPNVIVNSYIMAVKGGVDIGLDELEVHFLAGGSVPKVVMALIAAKKADYPLRFKEASAIDLAGRDPVAEVTESAVDWKFEFNQMGPNTPAPIEGNCRDGTHAGASVKVQYKLPVSLGSSKQFPLQSELAIRVLGYINDADSFVDLELTRDTHQSELLAFGKSALPGLHSLQLTYSRR